MAIVAIDQKVILQRDVMIEAEGTTIGTRTTDDAITRRMKADRAVTETIRARQKAERKKKTKAPKSRMPKKTKSLTKVLRRRGSRREIRKQREEGKLKEKRTLIE